MQPLGIPTFSQPTPPQGAEDPMPEPVLQTSEATDVIHSPAVSPFSHAQRPEPVQAGPVPHQSPITEVLSGKVPTPVEPLFDSNDVHMDNFYINADHRRMDLLWFSGEANYACLFHSQACGVVSTCCSRCGIMRLCYHCYTHLTRIRRSMCPCCNERPLLQKIFQPLF